MKYYLLIFCAFLLFSCEKKTTFTADNAPHQLQPTVSTKKMQLITGGKYKPFYGSKDTLVEVKTFLLDETPVTNAEFLSFVKANPQWQKSKVKRIYADSTYLSSWQNDLTLPKNASPNAPVTNVSWFAAKAYAQSVGKRLPTLDEWEYAAQADETDRNATKKPTYSAHIINLYNEKNKQNAEVGKSLPNAWGIYNMFDRVWEWTEDFNSVLTTGDSRNAVFDDKQLNCAGSAISANDIYNYAAFMRFAFRTSVKADYSVRNLGFRCAKDTLILKK